MRRVGICVCIIFFLFLPAGKSLGEDISINEPVTIEKYAYQLELEGKERVIVKFKDEIRPELTEKYGKIIRRLDIINAIACEVYKNDLAGLRSEPNVSKVIPDGIISIDILKRRHSLRDIIRRRLAQFLREYNLRNIIRRRRLAQFFAIDSKATLTKYDGSMTLNGYPDPWTDWNLQDDDEHGPGTGGGIAATTSWTNYSNIDGTGIKIAILDSGVNYTLPDLDEPQYLGGYDFVNDDEFPLDDAIPYGHGTQVASIALAQGELKIKGCAYNASYYSLKVIDENGDGFHSNILAAIQWATDQAHKADIISMSFGIYDDPGNPFWPAQKAEMEEALNNAYDAGIILIAGAGNDGVTDPFYPSDFENVIAVGGHAQDQTLFDYGGYSTNGGVDLVAPAEYIWAMDKFGEVDAGGVRWYYDGTSFAAPHVSGIAALMLQYARENNTDVNNGYFFELVKHSAIDLGFDELWQGKGKGRAKETIDLMSLSVWPFDYSFDYLGEVYWYWADIGGGESVYVPAYYIGTNMYQDIAITNISDTAGNNPEYIDTLNVTTTQAYFRHQGEAPMPGNSTEVFPPEILDPGAQIVLSDSYYMPWSTLPGLDKTILDFEFTFAGNGRVMRITDNDASIWCPPPAINEDFPVIELE